MNIIFEVLQELKYKAECQFKFKPDDKNEIEVSPFISISYPSQVFLVIYLDYDKLKLVCNGEFLALLTNEFCEQAFHTGQMDKNTSLIIKSFGSEEELKDTSKKIKIEDDPYYFKKYVFSCTKQAENKAINYFKNRKDNIKNNFSYVSEIQNYLLKLDIFEKYKENPNNEEIYSYIAELMTKIPIIPLRISSAKQLQTVKHYFDETLNKNGKLLNVEAIEKLLSHDEIFNNAETDELLNIWDSCIGRKGE